MSTFRKVTIILSILSLVLLGMGFSFSPTLAATCTKYHTVQKGEYLVKIAKIYGVNWRTIAEINKISAPWIIYPGQVLCISQDGTTPPPPPPGYSGFPTFSILSVVVDEDVTIQAYNLPPNDNFDVTMGPMGTKGVGGIKVDTVASGSGGSKQFTFDIPASLKGAYQIAIRLQSPTSGYFAYNWFFNNTSGKGGQPPPPPPGYTGFPTFSILSVVRDTSVTIQAYNLPPNDNFDVTMGPMGTKGVGGIKVDSVASGSGGSKQFTFTIPASLKGSYQISIRMQSPTSGFFAYNWFYNNTAVDP
jgi:hypothetical protein